MNERKKDLLDFISEREGLTFEESAALLELGVVLERQDARFWRGIHLLSRSLYAAHVEASIDAPKAKDAYKLIGAAAEASQLEQHLRTHVARVRELTDAFAEFEDPSPQIPGDLEE